MCKLAKLEKVNNEKVSINLLTQEQSSYENGFDTFSCCVQGLIPYGVQMLLAAGLAHISPIDILPYLYYPMAIGVAALMAILFRYPRRYS